MSNNLSCKNTLPIKKLLLYYKLEHFFYIFNNIFVNQNDHNDRDTLDDDIHSLPFNCFSQVSRTEGRTDGQTASYRDAETHLKTPDLQLPLFWKF